MSAPDPALFLVLGALGPGVLAWLAAVALHARRLLHVLQLEEYDLARFWRWVRAHPDAAWPPAQRIAVLALAVLAALTAAVASWLLAVSGPLALALALLLWWQRPRLAAKKPLVYTPKAILVAGIALALAGATVGAAAAWVALSRLDDAVSATVPLALALAGVLPPVYLTLGVLAVYPAQAAAKQLLVLLAAQRLRARRDLLVIGITGSYGKTSTKEILAALLGARYPVCKTTGSVNTPVGIARTVLRTLRPEHTVFVVEMGAYTRGNIRELARFVRPRVGVLTAIGEQHLERFGSVEAIAQTKYELIEALPPDGLAVFNADNPGCRALAAQTRHVRVRTYGLDPAGVPDVTATDVCMGPQGTTFTLRAAGHGAVAVTSPLLGRHNVSNVLAAATVALEHGLTLAEVAAAVGRLEPVPHRLQLLAGQNGVTVIDDAYNANPAGARAALEVLAAFPGRKVLVTPGLVELGPLEAERHAELGRAAAAVCDYIILVGRERTAAIAAGARAAGFPAERLFQVADLPEATARLGRLVAPGDVVLFENDLPDQYTE